MFSSTVSAALISIPAVLFATLEPPKPESPGSVELKISESPRGITATITASVETFVGALLVSDQPTLTHYLVDLPPLLTNAEVLLVGLTDSGRLDLFLPLNEPPPPMDYFTQAVVFDGEEFLSSDVVLYHPGDNGTDVVAGARAFN